MLRPASLPFAILLIALISFGPLSTDMYLPSLPTLIGVFGTDVAMVQLTLSAFLVGFALAQLAIGPTSDRFGRRPVLIAGISLYLAATVVCLVATSVEMLIAARVFQAVGACAGAVLARAVVRDVYGRQRAAKVLAYMGTAMALAPLVAPVIGGYLLIWFGWRSVFAVLAAFGATLLVLVATQLVETNRWKDPAAIDPGRMVRNYLTLAGSRAYVGYVLANAFVFGGLFAFISGSSFVLIGSLKVPVEMFGLFFAIVVAGYMAGTVIAGRLTLRLGIERMVLIGCIVSLAAGAVLAGLPWAGVTGVASIIAPMFVYLVGVGIVMPNAMAGAIGPFPRMAGAASALLGFLQMGMAALAGFLVGHFDDGTQVPMTATIAVMGLCAFTAFVTLARRR